MSYTLALEKAGATIIDYKQFGSYQGDWLAFVEYGGIKGIVQGSYGSCSGCDAFEGEFGYSSEPVSQDGKYYRNGDTWDEDNICSKEEFEEARKAYDERLAEFGRQYIGTIEEPDLYDKKHYEDRLAKLDSEDWFSEEE